MLKLCYGVLPLQRALSPQTSHALIKLFYKAHSRKRSAETSEAQLFGRQTYQRVLPWNRDFLAMSEFLHTKLLYFLYHWFHKLKMSLKRDIVTFLSKSIN